MKVNRGRLRPASLVCVQAICFSLGQVSSTGNAQLCDSRSKAHRLARTARVGPTRRGEFASERFLLRSSRHARASQTPLHAQVRHLGFRPDPPHRKPAPCLASRFSALILLKTNVGYFLSRFTRRAYDDEQLGGVPRESAISWCPGTYSRFILFGTATESSAIGIGAGHMPTTLNAPTDSYLQHKTLS